MGGASERTIADDAAMATTPRKTPPDHRQPEFRELRISTSASWVRAMPPELGMIIVRASMVGGNLNALR
jgi:hypothetical protein